MSTSLKYLRYINTGNTSQASINFTSLGVGAHNKGLRRAVRKRVFTNKPGCCDNKFRLFEKRRKRVLIMRQV